MEMAPVTSAIELAPAVEQECTKGKWAEAQTADPDIDAVRRYVKTRTMPPRSERQALSIRAQRLLQQYKKVKYTYVHSCASRLFALVSGAKKRGGRCMKLLHMRTSREPSLGLPVLLAQHGRRSSSISSGLCLL